MAPGRGSLALPMVKQRVLFLWAGRRLVLMVPGRRGRKSYHDDDLLFPVREDNLSELGARGSEKLKFQKG